MNYRFPGFILVKFLSSATLQQDLVSKYRLARGAAVSFDAHMSWTTVDWATICAMSAGAAVFVDCCLAGQREGAVGQREGGTAGGVMNHGYVSTGGGSPGGRLGGRYAV